MPNIPTTDELGVNDWVDAENQKQEKTFNKEIREFKQKRKSKEEGEFFTALNGMIFLIIIIPFFFTLILSMPRYFFYYWIIVWVHEAGHGFWGLFGSRILGALGGFLNETLFTLIPFLICLKQKKLYIAAAVFLMCFGLTLEFHATYMMTAQNPKSAGTSFAGSLTGRPNDMDANNHDWSFIFRHFGVLDRSFEIMNFTKAMGFLLLNIGLFSAIFGIIGHAVTVLDPYTLFFSRGAVATFFILLVFGGVWYQFVIAFLLSIPSLLKIIKKIPI